MAGSGKRRSRATLAALALALLGMAGCAPGAAGAAEAYVVDHGDGTLRSFDTTTNQVNGQPIGVGQYPVALAITPDGRFAYVLNEYETVTAVDLQNGFVSSPINVGGEPESVAITPDGRFAWVTTNSPGQLLTIEIATGKVVGGPVKICEEPTGVAITPDGRYAYVACYGKGRVWVIDTTSRERVGEPISVGESALGIAFTPDGSLAYVTDPDSGHVAVIDTSTRFLGAPIPAPISASRPFAIAISPDGRTGYLASSSVAYLASFAIPGGQPLVTAPTVEGIFEGTAVTPDGREVYVANVSKDAVLTYDARTLQPAQAIPIGEPRDIAISPDQPPRASFAVPDGRPGLPLAFDASASSDPDGTVAHYQWSFGDGSTSIAGPVARHAYKRPGDYRVTLTLTDAEGCSTALVFTGRTASCDGSPTATQTQAVQVAYPGVRVKCPKSAGRRGCHLKIQAVTRRRHAKAESAVSKAHVKAGGRSIVPLRAKPAFARKLGTAKRALVRERLSIHGHSSTRFIRLKIVR